MDVDENYQPFGSYLTPVDSSKHLSQDFHGELVILSMGRHIHVSNNLPPVTGESVVQEGDNDNTPADFSWYEASRVNVDGSVLTVTIARKMKDAPYVDTTPTERWTQWKKLELRSGGTVQSMMAFLQADGGFELVVADEKDLSVGKVKQLIQLNYIDKE
ncbi:hypothetical protein DAPPUDRAFT_114401 [Daphnia pulex]|uniref:Uncharacterized protein n=1 Tax=Daphnia pulex TaxID=6669 RepID=E9HI07_DAPPU|nr:hypothetical protein DAPPUDRAFT_114401 [Daphnia pulex]|eukprot:EFX68648.1 hypothetical protein DAPPUDRAFT_114401 [Daphnia pulex]